MTRQTIPQLLKRFDNWLFSSAGRIFYSVSMTGAVVVGVVIGFLVAWLTTACLP